MIEYLKGFFYSGLHFENLHSVVYLSIIIFMEGCRGLLHSQALAEA